MNPDFQYGQPSQPAQPVQPQQPMPQPYTQQGVPQIPQQQPQQPFPNYAPSGAPVPPSAPNPVNNFIVPPKRSKLWVILTCVFIFTTLAAAGVGVWAYMNYLDQKDNTDAKISTAVNTGVKNQADKDAADFLEKEKQPNRQFAGPDDYGRLAFEYPKTWSIYVNKDTSSGSTYEAYFNPVSVPPVKTTTQYALRVLIEERDVETVLANYDSLVKKGDLKTSAVKADDTDGTKLEGNFTKDIRGIAVVFKIRDKTVTLRTDAETFRGDFDALVSTITFNK
jgi:hypothetical protein